MNQRPYILITNDDGIHALGIKHLWQSLKDFADLIIVAPNKEQSSVGLSITVRDPIQIEEVFWAEGSKAWSVTGTPADCVKMALSVLSEKTPNLVVSGINRGANAGRNLLYSGTVGGAIEGVLHGIPAIAFSCSEYKLPRYDLVEKYIPKVVEYALSHPLPKGSLLNVNFPEKDNGHVKGFKMARQGLGFWGEDPSERRHPAEGHSYYWMGAKIIEFEEHEDSDIAWLNRGYMTAVPVHINELTDYDHLENKKELFEEFLEAHFLQSTL